MQSHFLRVSPNALAVSLVEDKGVVYDVAVVAMVGKSERCGVGIDSAPAKLKRAEHLPLRGRKLVRARLVPENLVCVACSPDHDYGSVVL